MANKHFANVGDIWKHLPLAEILRIEKPSHYWESHSGSAEYPLTHSCERDHGVFYFVQHASDSPTIRVSTYLEILKLHEQKGELTSYPASPLIAMTLLQRKKTDFLFCDIDSASLENIKANAGILGIPDSKLRLVQEDGVSTLAKVASDFPASQALDTFAHIDPYLPLERANSGFNSVELFCYLTKKNIKVMLWYGYDSQTMKDALLTELMKSIDDDSLRLSAHNLWCGDISLVTMRKSTLNAELGILGCSIVCSNLSRESISICNDLGESLAEIYKNARSSQGHQAAIQYDRLV